MRTDAKIGFAIVGVLLTVLAVYAVVIPKHAKTGKQAAHGAKFRRSTLQPEGTPSDMINVPPSDSGSIAQGGATKPPCGRAGRSNAGRTPSGPTPGGTWMAQARRPDHPVVTNPLVATKRDIDAQPRRT